MTAEQALIEENKKDPRVRYLSYNPNINTFSFWREKPKYNEIRKQYESWSYTNHISGIHLSNNNYFCLCIDDIKEVSTITEKTIENHPIMSIAESEREESQKEQEETRPAKTLYPRRMWIEDRLNAINQSVKSYLDNDYCIPTDWVEERNELIETLNNL